MFPGLQGTFQFTKPQFLFGYKEHSVHYLSAIGLIILYVLFCWLCWKHYQRQQKKLLLSNNSNADILIAYSSQTGNAANIAQQTANQLVSAGKEVNLLALNQIDRSHLVENKILLIVASTYGEGEAPDNGNRFISTLLSRLEKNSLSHLQIAILGLGDSAYKHFCGFAHQLQHQLHHCGAHFLTDVIEVDRLDAAALRHWQYYLGQISGNTHFEDWSKASYSQWKMVQREHINPGSPGAPVFHLKLIPQEGKISTRDWSAGDIAEIGPGNNQQQIQNFLKRLGRETIAPELLVYKNLSLEDKSLQQLQTLNDAEILEQLTELPQREYSIASVPEESSLALLVRQVEIAPGQYGLGSGWLTVHAALNQFIYLRIRRNAHFHSPDSACPLILIGNGTGIAGLRAHLANPARRGTENWLFFGERTESCDKFFNQDILHWQNSGLLTHVDRVFSRDAKAGEPRYVQDLLLSRAEELKAWVNKGSAIYVCGSLQGMAQAVDEVLGKIIGVDLLEQMADTRLYCRDVY